MLVKGVLRRVAVLKDRAFLHFQKTALVTERLHEGERKFRRRVLKVGIDPHFSFANMLCDVASARADRRTTFVLPGAQDSQGERGTLVEQLERQGAPAVVLQHLAPLPPGEVCGRCVQCPVGVDIPPEGFFCKARQFITQVGLTACPDYVPV